MHIGDLCVICALYQLLAALSKSFGKGQKKVVEFFLFFYFLRKALSNRYANSYSFQEVILQPFLVYFFPSYIIDSEYIIRSLLYIIQLT